MDNNTSSNFDVQNLQTFHGKKLLSIYTGGKGISWQVHLVRIDLVVIDLVRIGLVTLSRAFVKKEAVLSIHTAQLSVPMLVS